MYFVDPRTADGQKLSGEMKVHHVDVGIAGVSQSISISVVLSRVRRVRAIVYGVGHPVAITIGGGHGVGLRTDVLCCSEIRIHTAEVGYVSVPSSLCVPWLSSVRGRFGTDHSHRITELAAGAVRVSAACALRRRLIVTTAAEDQH